MEIHVDLGGWHGLLNVLVVVMLGCALAADVWLFAMLTRAVLRHLRADTDVTAEPVGEQPVSDGGGFVDSERVDAVNHLAQLFDAILPGEGAGFSSLNCIEADGLATVLAVHGHRGSAANVIAGHCLDDDRGDVHGYIAALDGMANDELDEAAEVYVRRMMGETTAQPREHSYKVLEMTQLVYTLVENAHGVYELTDEQVREGTDRVWQLRLELGDDLAEMDREEQAGTRPWDHPANR